MTQSETTHAQATPDELRLRMRMLLRRATEELKIDEARLQGVLGLSASYMNRVKAEAGGGARTSDASARKFLTERNLTALTNLCELVEERRNKPLARHVIDYERSVVEELGALRDAARAKGRIRHTLVFVPPPLEVDRPQVRRAVIEAAYEGVEFRYLFPSEETTNHLFDVLGVGRVSGAGEVQGLTSQYSSPEAQRQIAKMKERLNVIEGVFSWIRDIKTNIDKLMRTLLLDARLIDLNQGVFAEKGPGPFEMATRRQIRFWPLRWLPISLNEKIVWITGSPTQDTIRKETWDASSVAGEQPIYSDEQVWHQSQYTIDACALRAILFMSREGLAPLAWPTK